MKFSLLMVLFVLIAWTGVKAMMLNSESPETIDFPVFHAPTLSFQSIPSDCGLLDCVTFVGKVIINIVLSFVYVALLIFNLVVYFVGLLSVVVQTAFTPIPGAPGLVNILIGLPYAAGAAIILFTAFRKGDTTA